MSATVPSTDLEEPVDTTGAAAAAPHRARSLPRLIRIPEVGVLGGLLVLIAAFSLWQPASFATLDNARNVLTDASILVVLAMATTFVIVGAQLDLSIGGVIAFVEVVTAKAFAALGGQNADAGVVALGLVLALVLGLAWGVVNGLLVTRLRIAPFVATLATLSIAQGAAYVVSGGVDLATVPAGLTQAVGVGALAGVPTLIVIAAAVVVSAGYALHRTRFGRHTYAIGSDATAAARAGIDVPRHVLKLYALAGGAYGLAAFLNLARFSTTTVGGHNSDGLNAITAVALGGASLYGGIGSVLGSLVGVFIPAVLQNGLVIAQVQPFYAQIGVGIALIGALYADQLRRARRDDS